MKVRIKTTSAINEHFDDDDAQDVRFVPLPSHRLLVKRKGHSITRHIPKPVILIDTRKTVTQNLYIDSNLFIWRK